MGSAHGHVGLGPDPEVSDRNIEAIRTPDRSHARALGLMSPWRENPIAAIVSVVIWSVRWPTNIDNCRRHKSRLSMQLNGHEATRAVSPNPMEI
jgi:hypothetical protein